MQASLCQPQSSGLIGQGITIRLEQANITTQVIEVSPTQVDFYWTCGITEQIRSAWHFFHVPDTPIFYYPSELQS